MGIDKALEVLESLEKLSEKEFVPCIGPLKGRILEQVIKERKVTRILEVGTLFGYSAILMARLLPPGGHVTTIEINSDRAGIAGENIIKAGLSGKIEVILGDALEVIPELEETFDLLFLDAAKEEYLQYLKLAEKNLEKGSVVVADNVLIFEKYMQDYLDYVRNSGMYESKTVKVPLEFSKGTEDAMEISVKVSSH